jgi:hypothetical protein
MSADDADTTLIPSRGGGQQKLFHSKTLKLHFGFPA